MNIGLISLQYGGLTGSETYMYTLAKTLHSRGHKVSISCVSKDGPLISRTENLGIPISYIADITSYPDVYHVQHAPAVEALLAVDHLTPKLMTIHSDIIPHYEEPVEHYSIKKYVGVRPAIIRMLAKKNITAKLIYNGIDTAQFRRTPLPAGGPIILFAGTKDHLREKVAVDLINEVANRSAKIIFCGHGWGKCASVSHPSVMFLNGGEHIERMRAQATEVAGVQMGRWELEGWLMGRPSIEYTVDQTGDIVKKRYRRVPANITRYTADYMTTEYEKLYRQLL